MSWLSTNCISTSHILPSPNVALKSKIPNFSSGYLPKTCLSLSSFISFIFSFITDDISALVIPSFPSLNSEIFN